MNITDDLREICLMSCKSCRLSVGSEYPPYLCGWLECLNHWNTEAVSLVFCVHCATKLQMANEWNVERKFIFTNIMFHFKVHNGKDADILWAVFHHCDA